MRLKENKRKEIDRLLDEFLMEIQSDGRDCFWQHEFKEYAMIDIDTDNKEHSYVSRSIQTLIDKGILMVSTVKGHKKRYLII